MKHPSITSEGVLHSCLLLQCRCPNEQGIMDTPSTSLCNHQSNQEKMSLGCICQNNKHECNTVSDDTEHPSYNVL